MSAVHPAIVRPTLSVRPLKVPAIALAAIALFAIHAWVIQVDGNSSLGRRAVLLGIVAVVSAGIHLGAPRLNERLRATGMLLLGVLGATIIGPIVVSHIMKLGVQGSRITGIVAVAGSIVLIAVGSTRLIRSARSIPRKLLALPVAFVLLQFMVVPLSMSVYVTNAAHPELGTRTPADVGLDFEDVTIASEDGTRLAAWYVPSVNGSVVLLRHGSGSTRTSVLDHAAFLARSGYGVLLTDARGHGESGGRINEWGWHGPEDIAAALDFVQRRPDFTGSIGVLGLSMGGEEAVNAAAIDRRIASVVADGAGVSSYNDSVVSGAHIVARSVNWIQFRSAQLLTDARQPVGVAASMSQIGPRPVLLIAGSDPVERKMGPIYKEKGGATVQLWRLEDTPHTGGLEKHGAEYRERVLRFFEQALLAE